VSVSIACPIEPYMLDKRMRRGLEQMVDRVVAANVLQDGGHDLLLRVYLSGLYHGAEVVLRKKISADGAANSGTGEQ